MSESRHPDLIVSAAGTVILFYPDEGVFDRVRGCLQSLDRMYLLDNSGCTAGIPFDLKNDPRIVYLPQSRNLGQAAALNAAAARARQDGYSWLLTLDQDSSFKPGVLETYLRAFRAFEPKGNCALFSPAHQPVPLPAVPHEGKVSEPETLMTSGNLLNLEIHASLGGFHEPLFIDTVDHDYCLRARLAGFRLVCFDAIVMDHEVGEALWVEEQGRKVRITTHPPERMYTITRNNLRLWWKFYRVFPQYIKHRIHFYFFRTLRHIFLYEDRKLAKLGFSLRGAFDFLRGRYGPAPVSQREAYDQR